MDCLQVILETWIKEDEVEPAMLLSFFEQR
jgi:hypothetical protein